MFLFYNLVNPLTPKDEYTRLTPCWLASAVVTHRRNHYNRLLLFERLGHLLQYGVQDFRLSQWSEITFQSFGGGLILCTETSIGLSQLY